jgi:hypothetical protein
MKIMIGIGAITLSVIAATGVKAQSSHEDPVLDLLVKKGLVSQQEADTAKSEEKDLEESAPASKFFLNNPSIQKLEFYGDGRFRFENIDQHNHYETNTLTDRERYRLRFGLDYTYSPQFKAGFELESGLADDTANQTMGSTFTKAPIGIGKVYLQYSPTDWFTAVAGKFTNPWYTTSDMVYWSDLSPEGGAELFNFRIPLDDAPSGDPKDVKNVHGGISDSLLSVGLNSVQYLYVNSNEGTFPKGLNNNDVFIIGNQIPITWRVNKELLFKVAPGFTFYTGGGNTNYDSGVPTGTGSSIPASTPSVPGSFFGTANSAIDPVFYSAREADDLAIFSAPGEINFDVAGIPFRPYWDFEWNTEGKKRIQNVYLQNDDAAPIGGVSTGVSAAAAKQNQALGDDVAWSAGLQIGANKKRGDWSVLGEFRQIGLGAVDQNINGTDFADSYANQEGIKVAGSYNFTDFLTATATFYDTWDYKKGLYQSLGGGNGTPSAQTASTINLVGEKSSQRLQLDLGWKF